jgi:AcrR family transcriptional regulator
LSPKIVNKEKRREELALTALEVFAEIGFKGGSINTIAKAAGIAKGTIYEYFENKEDLIYHALMAWFRVLEAQTLELQEVIEDPEKRLRILVRAAVDAFTTDPRTLRLTTSIIDLTLTNKRFIEKYDIVRESFQGMRKLIRNIILNGISNGTFSPSVAKDADKIATNLFAYLDGIYLHHILSNGSIDLHGHIEFYLDELIRDMKNKPEGEDMP